MIIDRQGPLAAAAKVLKPTTIQAVCRSPAYHLRGWNILDRWAVSDPEKLLALEAKGEVILLGRLLEQQAVEHSLLIQSLEARQQGLTEHEIFSHNEIQTRL